MSILKFEKTKLLPEFTNHYAMKTYSIVFWIEFLFILTGISQGQTREYLYVGTFSVRGSEGVYVFSFDRLNGRFDQIGTVHSLNDPTFLEISPDKKYLYTANRQSVDTSKDKGSVTSYLINSKTGLLSEINRSSSYGNSPCHINVSPDGRWLFASHYKDGSLTILSTDMAGKITGLADSVIHRGSSINKLRQEMSHAHSTNFIPGTDYFVTADLGTDKLWINKWNDGKINRTSNMTIESVPGSGPRHFDFYKGKQWIYVAEELSSTVSVFDINLKEASAKPVQRISTIPDTFKQTNTAADIHLSPDQKFLYVSNRGHNSIAIFKINGQSGKITFVGYQSSLGNTPRNFYIHKQGEFVLIANQDSDNIIFFKRDKETGLLIETEQKLQVPSPVCLKMVIFP